MDQDIRFCHVDGRRLAYATVGEGPLLAMGVRFVSHLEADWEDDRFREFVCELAETHRVVRFDRLGAGLSDRAEDGELTIQADVRSLAAILDVFGDEPAVLFTLSCACPSTAPYAQRQPQRVDSLIFFGGFAARDDLTEAKKSSLVDFVRSNWDSGRRRSPASSSRTGAVPTSTRSRRSSGARRARRPRRGSSSSSSAPTFVRCFRS